MPTRVAHFDRRSRNQFWGTPDLRWQTWYRHSNSLLGGHEQCDCVRTQEGNTQQRSIENRRYQHGSLMLEFFFWGGWQEAAGSLSRNPSQVDNLPCGPGRGVGNASGHQQPAWSASAANLLRSLVTHGCVLPTHVFIGNDVWFDAFRFGKRAVPSMYDWAELAAAARHVRVRTNATVLWRTTPQPLKKLLGNSSQTRAVHRHGPDSFDRVGLPTFEGAELADRLQSDLFRDQKKPTVGWSMPGSAFFSRDAMHLLPAGTLSQALELARRYVCSPRAEQS